VGQSSERYLGPHIQDIRIIGYAAPIAVHHDIVGHEAQVIVEIPVESERDVVFFATPDLAAIQTDATVAHSKFSGAGLSYGYHVARRIDSK